MAATAGSSPAMADQGQPRPSPDWT